MFKKIVTFASATLLAIGLASAPALARGGGHGGGGFHGGGFHGGGFHGGGFARHGFGHSHFFVGGLGYGLYDPYYYGGAYAYDDYPYDNCYARLVRVHGHWVRRTYCG